VSDTVRYIVCERGGLEDLADAPMQVEALSLCATCARSVMMNARFLRVVLDEGLVPQCPVCAVSERP
jgi:hypothetical protein